MLLFNQIQNYENQLSEILKKSLFYLKKKFIHGSVELKKTCGFFVSTRYKNIDKIESYDNVSCIITIYNFGYKSSVSLNNITLPGIYKAIDKAIEISKNTEYDVCSTLPKKKLLFNSNQALNIFFPWLCDIKKILTLVQLTEKSALEFDSRITNTEGAVFDSSMTIKYSGNSYDWMGSHCSTYNYLSNCVIASNKNSMERDFSYTIARDFNDLKSPELVGETSARKSILKLNSRKINTQCVPVIFSSDISSGLFKYLSIALNGHAVYKKTTFLFNYFKKKIFPEWLSIFEDPFLDKGLSSQLFDDEGVSTCQRKIINKGYITTWLLDTYSANKLNVNSTGHSGGTYNWLVQSCNPVLTYKSLLKEMNRGLLITELFGSGVNIMTGDYSRGACGFWIEQGKIMYPVSEITISGNLLNIWNKIITLSDDVQTNSSIHCSSILIDNMQISGN